MESEMDKETLVKCELCGETVLLANGRTLESVLDEARKELGDTAVDSGTLYLICDDCKRSAGVKELLMKLEDSGNTTGVVNEIRDAQIRAGEMVVYRRAVEAGLITNGRLVMNDEIRRDAIVELCPFCEAGIDKLSVGDVQGSVAVSCDVCVATGPLCDTNEDAIQSWNAWGNLQKQVFK